MTNNDRWKKFAILLISVCTLLLIVVCIVLMIGVCNTNSVQAITEQSLNAFTSVDIATSSAKVEFIPSDHYGLELCVPENCALGWGNADRQLTVRADKKQSFLSFDFSDNSRYFVKVYYPKDTVFENVTLVTSSGGVALPETEIHSLSVKCTSGAVKVDLIDCGSAHFSCSSGDITVSANDQTATKIQVKTTSGKVRLDGTSWMNLSAEASSGDIKISGELVGETRVSTTSGNVELSVSGNATEYSYDLARSSGTIRVNDQETGTPARSSGTAENKITVKTSSGDITVNFTR